MTCFGTHLHGKITLDPPTSTRFSFAHLNVNGIDVDGRIVELRYLFQNKPFDIIGIKETKRTENMATSNFKIDGYEMFIADCMKSGKNQVMVVLFM